MSLGVLNWSEHSHSMKNGLETHEKGIVVCYYVFFVGM